MYKFYLIKHKKLKILHRRKRLWRSGRRDVKSKIQMLKALFRINPFSNGDPVGGHYKYHVFITDVDSKSQRFRLTLYSFQIDVSPKIYSYQIYISFLNTFLSSFINNFTIHLPQENYVDKSAEVNQVNYEVSSYSVTWSHWTRRCWTRNSVLTVETSPCLYYSS